MIAILTTLLALVLAGCGDEREVTPVARAASADAPPVAAEESAPPVTQSVKFRASDGAELHGDVRGAGDLQPRPLIVEFSPYGMGSSVPDFGPDYNHVYVHARGTGMSTGVWTAVGPRDQQDVAEFLEWACTQPWSDGRIGLYGFSASAIAVYNSMHLPLECVKAAALMAGTNDLYRDLLYPGGIPNTGPAFVVGFGVGLPILAASPQRFQEGQSPLEPLAAGIGIFGLAIDLNAHPTEDEYWLARTQRPGPNTFPVLANTGFYDVESHGPFESYQMLRDQGVPVHLRVLGAHDGVPAGTPGPFPEYRRWFDRFLLGAENGIDAEPRVQLLIGHGGYAAQIAGAVTHVSADDWPLPGTRWQSLYLDPKRGGGTVSSNDGTLSTAPPAAQARLPHLAVTSLPTATDPNTTATVGPAGANALFAALPQLTDLRTMEPLALTWSTPRFAADLDVIGPASLEIHVATLLPEGDLYAIVADVWPDGSSHAVGIGRLRTSYPHVVAERSRIDDEGQMVQPYPDHSAKTPAAPLETREYRVELWPIGNRFAAGHRLRVVLVGAPAYQLPAPNLGFVSVGGATPSRLLLPVAPGQDFCAALPASC